MKKSILLVLVAMMLAFAGCQEEKPVNTPGTTKAPEGTETEQPVAGEDSTVSPDTEKDTEQLVTPEPKKVEPKLYERLDAWDEFYKEYNSYYTAIQIEDMFFHPGMLGSELAEAVESSKDTAIMPLSVGKLMEPGRQTVTFYRNEVPWFDAWVQNYTDDLLPFGECIVSLFVPCDAVMEYCRFFDGTYTMESIRGINYQEYDNFKASMEKIGYTMEKKGSEWEIIRTGEFCPASLSETVLYWTWQLLFVDMKIDSDTGMVSTVDFSGGTGECELYTETIQDNFNWGEENVAKQLVQLLYSDGFCDPEAEEIIETVCVYSGEDDNNYIMLYRIQDADEQIKYAVYNKRNIGLNFRKEIIELPDVSEGYGTRFWIIEGSCTDAYQKINEVNPDGKLIYEYIGDCKGLVKEDFKISLWGDVLTVPTTLDRVMEFLSPAGARSFVAQFSDYDLGAGESNFALINLSGGRTAVASITNYNDYTCDIAEGTVTGVIVDSDERCIFPLGYQFGDLFDLEKTIQQLGEYDSTFVYAPEEPGVVPPYTQYSWQYKSGDGEGWYYTISKAEETGTIYDIQIGYWKE